jgi:hypothetical protein
MEIEKIDEFLQLGFFGQLFGEGRLKPADDERKAERGIRLAVLARLKELTHSERTNLARDCAQALVLLEERARCGVPVGNSDRVEWRECRNGLKKIQIYGVDCERIYDEERQPLKELEAQWCNICQATMADCWCWRR